MIYTSYFGKLSCKSLPDNIIPISICAKVPGWYHGFQYKKLAPKYDFFMKWKKDHDNEHYIKCFNEQVLDKLNASQVIMELKNLVGENLWNNHDICLICYEKPKDFCHRHLVAEWLNNNGYKCKEWSER